MSGDKKIKKFIGITATMLGTVFAGMEIQAKMKKDDSVYKDEPSEQNPMEGKKVVFIEDDNDLENADGVRGHLEAIGDSECHPGFYEKYVKIVYSLPDQEGWSLKSSCIYEDVHL